MKNWILLAAMAAPLSAQSTGAELFEKSIRPVLANKCYGCHSSKSTAPMGGLVLDTKSGLKKGGANGPVVVPGDAAASRIIRALSYSDAQLRMPPTGKLADSLHLLALLDTRLKAAALGESRVALRRVVDTGDQAAIGQTHAFHFKVTIIE